MTDKPCNQYHSLSCVAGKGVTLQKLWETEYDAPFIVCELASELKPSVQWEYVILTRGSAFEVFVQMSRLDIDVWVH